MTFETPEDNCKPPKRLSARGLLLAGVAGAAVLGLGLGLWARPAMSERRMVAAPAPEPAAIPPPARQIQIVVDDTPAPIGKPIEVLPAAEPARSMFAAPPALPPVEPRAPSGPPPGLTRVLAIAPAPSPAPRKAEPPPRPTARPETIKAPTRKPVQIARATAKPADRPAHLAKAQSKAKAPQLAAAKTSRHEERLRLAKAEARQRAHAEALQAQADARPRGRLAGVAHILARMVAPHFRSEPQPEARAEKVKGPGRHKPHGQKTAKLVKVSNTPPKPARKHVEPHRAAPVRTYRAHAPAPPPAPAPRASGLMKVSNRPRCALADPGAALVCADPSLGAADRQLSRAYRQARAAGVSDDRLQRQQQRWLAARSAAAREAPWAVHDVYLARIAELNGMAREAHDGGSD